MKFNVFRKDRCLNLEAIKEHTNETKKAEYVLLSLFISSTVVCNEAHAI